MPKLPFQNADPAHTSFQFLEDLSTAYWYSELLFSALELGVFDSIEKEYPTTDLLAELLSCKVDGLARMLTALERIDLIMQSEGRWCNSQITTKYLSCQSDFYMGGFLLYRRYMQSGWQSLSTKISQDGFAPQNLFQANDDYAKRTYNYVLAMDQLATRKSEEIVEILDIAAWQLPILDVGGGAGSLSRALLRRKVEQLSNSSTATPNVDLLELEEVLVAGQKIYDQPSDWAGINTIAGDFRQFSGTKKYGLIVLSNFLHAYGSTEAKELLFKAISFLAPGGVILIHDYFPDRLGVSPAKGPLYDIAMMLNTYNGCCHNNDEVTTWLNDGGMNNCEIRDLDTDSSIIVAVQSTSHPQVLLPGRTSEHQEWPYYAKQEGLQRAVIVKSSQIVTAPWVRKKCQCGCERYGKNIHCPPNGMESDATRKLIDSYSWAVLVEGVPPGRDFHKKLLALEKRAFLSGYHKAFAFIAGHCPVCDNCPEDGICRLPGKARPSMEASGIDVYETVAKAGLTLHPVREKMQYVKYYGLLMLE